MATNFYEFNLCIQDKHKFAFIFTLRCQYHWQTLINVSYHKITFFSHFTKSIWCFKALNAVCYISHCSFWKIMKIPRQALSSVCLLCGLLVANAAQPTDPLMQIIVKVHYKNLWLVIKRLEIDLIGQASLTHNTTPLFQHVFARHSISI